MPVEAVHNEIFDLFALLEADEAQLDFPTLFASGREGWAVADSTHRTAIWRRCST